MSGTLNHDFIMRLAIVRPSLQHLSSYLECIEEMRVLGETIWPSRQPGAEESGQAFVHRVLVKETAPEPPSVPESVFWGVVEGHVVGVIAFRHHLNEQLSQFGGHIGYEVRPSCRRRGVATALLRLVLATDRAKLMQRILVTCAPTNEASRKSIEANGGVLTGIVYSEQAKRETCHYWIDLGGRS